MLSKTEHERIDEEIMNGEFELQLDEATTISVASPKILPLKTRSNTYTEPSKTTINNIELTTCQKSMPLDMDELLKDIDQSLASPQPFTLRPRRASEPVIYRYQRIFRGDHAGAGFFDQSKFCDTLKAEIQKTYSVDISIIKSKDKSHHEKLIYIINFKSYDQNNIHQAREAFESFFTTLTIKVVDDRSGFWVKYPASTKIIQSYIDQNEHLHILCEHETIGLMISYFNKDKSNVFINLCTTDSVLDQIIKEKFLSLEISLPSTSDLAIGNKSNLAQNILKLENEIQSKNILMILEQQHIRLFGLVDIIKDIEKQIEEFKTKYSTDTVKLNLESKQIKYLFDICFDDLKTLETHYIDTKIIDTIKNGEFIAPKYLHDTIEKQIMILATLCSPMTFKIEHEAFRVIALNECDNLINIGRQNKCQIEIEKKIEPYNCEIPKATIHDHISYKLAAMAIKIHMDDLAEQKVDLIVICSTSMYLRDNILEKAGPSVKQEYIDATRISSLEPFEINSGQLLCQKLLLLPWEINYTSEELFYQSIRNFVKKAIQHAIKAHHTSIAFPSFDCGKLNVDQNIVANEMLVEAQKQLLTANVLLQIIFVILPEQIEVFDAFQSKLEKLQQDNIEIKDKQISYNLTTLTITIISSNIKKQEDCKNDLNNYVEKSTLVRELLQQDVLKKWTQPAINAFYTYCQKQQVLIDMNINIGYLKLFGSKESVREAENEYFREQTKQSEQARLAAIARNTVWAYKIDNNNWEKYSPELNARIEDMYSSKISFFNYINIKSEEYIIDFQTMTETCINNQQQHEIIRHVDFDLPQYWEVQSQNIAEFTVQVNSDEYKDILTLFDKTMTNQYTELLHIKRIQNKQWYTQYNSYKRFSSIQNTERKLFHGCPEQSARLIINSFFNRSFAGINGTVYGQGAYFSANANFSDGFTRANKLNGERCMFVANVLVGNSIKGNTHMKTPPAGFDSTTDGDHIFVTYRDDQAYGAYLIIYK